MVVLRSFALLLIVYALVVMETTTSNNPKVGQKETRKNDERETKERKVRGQCPKVKGRLSVIVRC